MTVFRSFRAIAMGMNEPTSSNKLERKRNITSDHFKGNSIPSNYSLHSKLLGQLPSPQQGFLLQVTNTSKFERKMGHGMLHQYSRNLLEKLRFKAI